MRCHVCEQSLKARHLVLGFLLCALFVIPSGVAAKSYVYESFEVEATVNKDSSVDIREKITMSFDGSFSKGWRDISLKDIGAISDIRVVNADTGESLERSASEEPGTYTVSRESGAVSVRWYHDSTDETRTWTLAYTARGAISFLGERDELYWNLFTDLDEPVRESSMTVRVPGKISPAQFESRLYPQEKDATRRVSTSSVTYVTGDTAPGESVTVAVGFPDGVVDESTYWYWWLWRNDMWLAAIVVVLATALIAFGWWLQREVIGTGRGTVVAEYEPPEGLPPAVGEVIVNESISSKTWPATIVDLAVRGHVTITEEKGSVWWGVLKKMLQLLGLLPVLAIIGVFVYVFFGSLQLALGAAGALLFAAGVYSMSKAGSIGAWVQPSYYKLERTDGGSDALRAYEKQLLNALFSVADDGVFSTRVLQQSKSKRRTLSKLFDEIKKELYSHTAQETGLYARGPRYGEMSKAVLVIAGFLNLFLLIAFDALPFGQTGGFLAVTAVSVGALFLFIRFEPRLTDEGEKERERWLGFKQYLETAEKYRLQDLTPETFQRFLPYAMVFGVEKKWARAFEGMDIQDPSWHHATGSGVGSAAAGGFSPSSFGTSMSSSFASSISSATGGGGSGAASGGGSAGGGAGGGGGGAA